MMRILCFCLAVSSAADAQLVGLGPMGFVQAGADPATAGLLNGDYVIAWRKDNAVFAQRFGAGSAAVAGPVQANLHGNSTAYGASVPCAAAAVDGGFVVAWLSNADVYAQIFDKFNLAVGNHFKVNSAPVHDHSRPACSGGPDGFIIAWASGATSEIFARQFSTYGGRKGAEIRVSTPSQWDHYQQAVAVTKDGGFAVTWNVYNPHGGGHVYLRVFSADGTSNGNETQVTEEEADVLAPSLLVLEGGEVVVAWPEYRGGPGASYVLWCRKMLATGEAAGSMLEVDERELPVATVAMASTDQGVLIAWFEAGAAQPAAIKFHVLDANATVRGTTALLMLTGPTAASSTTLVNSFTGNQPVLVTQLTPTAAETGVIMQASFVSA